MKKFFSSIADFCGRHKLTASVAVSALAFLVSLAISGFNIGYAANDDYAISTLISTGSRILPFVSVFWSYPVGFLQNLLPAVNMHVCCMLVLSFVSLAAIVFTILKTAKKTADAVFITAVFLVMYAMQFVVYIQFTLVSTILATTAFLLPLTFGTYEKKRHKILCVAVSLVLLLISSFLRHDSYKPVTLVCAVCIAACVVSEFFSAEKQRGVKALAKAALSSLKPYIACLLVLVVGAGACSVCYRISTDIKNEDKAYKTFSTLNYYRGNVIDYEIPDFSENKEFYAELGIKSENDLNVFRNWIIDYNFFNRDRLYAISSASKESRLGFADEMRAFAEKRFPSLGFNAFAAVCVCLLAAYNLLLLIFNKKLKHAYFLSTLAFLAGAIAIFGSLHLRNITVCLIFIEAHILSGFRPKSAIRNFLFAETAFLVFAYAYYSRINYRAVFTFAFPVFVFTLLSVNEEIVLPGKIKEKMRPVLRAVPYALMAAVTVFSSAYFYVTAVSPILKPVVSNSNLREYIEDHPDSFFIIDSSAGISKYYNEPLRADSYLPNAYSMGWTAEMPYQQENRENFGLGNIFPDSIDKENVYYVMVSTSSIRALMLQEYLTDHYSENGSCVTLSLCDCITETDADGNDVKNICFYNIISK